MASGAVIHQPGLAGPREYSGSVQYLGGFDGPYVDDEGVVIKEKRQPPPQLPIPMGLEVFEKVSKLVAHQVVDGNEAWWHRMNFSVDDGAGNMLFDVKEVDTMNNGLQCLMGLSRPFYLKVINLERGSWIMEFEHPASCICPVLCPWASPEMTVRMPTGEVLGHIKHSARETCGSWFAPCYYFEVYNYEGNLKYKVQGPTAYPCECKSSNPVTFKIIKEGTQLEPARLMGEITHSWRGCCGGLCSCCVTGEPDYVTVSFAMEISAEDKALFLGLLFAVMHAYLEIQ